MKKHFRLTAAAFAATLFTLGFSTVSFASSKGTWAMIDGEWYCYDSNGDVYENTFCASNGKDYYVGDGGSLVRSDWVDYEGSYYFVNSAGQKIVNDWRWTVPFDDEDGEPGWYYFQSTGKMAESKKLTIKSKVYFFDSDGRMLTGWVTADGTDVTNEEGYVDTENTYYCDETGASLRAAWIKTTEPGEEDNADADEYWYYLKTTGRVAVGKNASINGQTYLFDGSGRMLSGWVAFDGAKYFEIDGRNDTYALSDNGLEAVYYCGGEDDGHMKKNKWMKLWRPEDAWEEDYDIDQFWFWIQSDGKVYIPSDSNASQGYTYELGDGRLEYKDSVLITQKRINSKDYFFNQDGEMLYDFVEIATNSNASLAEGMYYFGGADDGAMKTGSQSVKDDNGDTYKFYFGTTNSSAAGEKKGVGITGVKNSKLYYKGLLIQPEDYAYQTVTIDGHTFIVNRSGTVQHGQSQYKDGSDVLIDTKTVTEGDEVVYQVVYSTAEEQWKYCIDEEASVGALKNYAEPFFADRIMDTVTD